MSGCADLDPRCVQDPRKQELRASVTLGGVDYVDVDSDGVTLCVRLFGKAPEGLSARNVVIEGGERITQLNVLAAYLEAHEDGPCLRVTLDRTGDFSTYCLCLVEPAAQDAPCSYAPDPPPPLRRAVPPGIDPRYGCAEFRFRLDCPAILDLAPAPCEIPAPAPAPKINYLARDFGALRQMIFDRLSLTLPDYAERHAADIGVTLVELLAYVGDRLHYQIDAVATEAYLTTARRRISLRRHARLLDYRMHEGCNARAFVALEVAGGDWLGQKLSDLVFAAGATAGGLIDLAGFGAQAILFEPIDIAGQGTADFRASHSLIPFHTWGGTVCRLLKGATRATLRDAFVGDNARALQLKVGDVLIFEEVRGAFTGLAADADRAKRWPVRLTRVEAAIDPLSGAPVVEIAWGPGDALPFALTLSARTKPRAPAAVRVDKGGVVRLPLRSVTVILEAPPRHGDASFADGVLSYRPQADYEGSDVVGLVVISQSGARSVFEIAFVVGDPLYCEPIDVAVARGNVVLVDHGVTAEESDDGWQVGVDLIPGCCRCEGAAVDIERRSRRFGMQLASRPITQTVPFVADPQAPASALCRQDPRAAVAAIRLDMAAFDDVGAVGSPFAGSYDWQARFDLLSSGPADRHFVAEIDDDGFARLRFGDGDCGAAPPAGARFRARLRVGTGGAGNVGAEAISAVALRNGKIDGLSVAPRNPLPAEGGVDAEAKEEVRRLAPHAYGRRLERAVTAPDYADLAARDATIQAAEAEMAWTGLVYEASVALDPWQAAAADAGLAPAVQARLAAARRIGHDVRLVAPAYVPLRIAALVCVDPAYARADVLRAVRALASDAALGLFNPDRLSFGVAVASSQILAPIQALDGVVHVEITRFQRMDDSAPLAQLRLSSGLISMAANEIAQLENNPDFPERGLFEITITGGR